MLHFQARDLATKRGISCTDLKVSRGWITRFVKRGLSLRRRTSFRQRIPKDFDDKVIDFHRYVIQARKSNNYVLSQTANADHTPLNFDMPHQTTITEKGDKSMIMRTTGCEKQRCTTMLAISAYGRKLPPCVIFKRKTMPNGKFPPGIHVRVQEKGWMATAVVQDWNKRSEALLRRPALLV
jgi:hypothetical protein